jgi:hypothetical protein
MSNFIEENYSNPVGTPRRIDPISLVLALLPGRRLGSA